MYTEVIPGLVLLHICSPYPTVFHVLTVISNQYVCYADKLPLGDGLARHCHVVITLIEPLVEVLKVFYDVIHLLEAGAVCCWVGCKYLITV